MNIDLELNVISVELITKSKIKCRWQIQGQDFIDKITEVKSQHQLGEYLCLKGMRTRSGLQQNKKTKKQRREPK